MDEQKQDNRVDDLARYLIEQTPVDPPRYTSAEVVTAYCLAYVSVATAAGIDHQTCLDAITTCWTLLGRKQNAGN